jgi:hypothetical protein
MKPSFPPLPSLSRLAGETVQKIKENWKVLLGLGIILVITLSLARWVISWTWEKTWGIWGKAWGIWEANEGILVDFPLIVWAAFASTLLAVYPFIFMAAVVRLTLKPKTLPKPSLLSALKEGARYGKYAFQSWHLFLFYHFIWLLGGAFLIAIGPASAHGPDVAVLGILILLFWLTIAGFLNSLIIVIAFLPKLSLAFPVFVAAADESRNASLSPSKGIDVLFAIMILLIAIALFVIPSATTYIPPLFDYAPSTGLRPGLPKGGVLPLAVFALPTLLMLLSLLAPISRRFQFLYRRLNRLVRGRHWAITGRILAGILLPWIAVLVLTWAALVLICDESALTPWCGTAGLPLLVFSPAFPFRPAVFLTSILSAAIWTYSLTFLSVLYLHLRERKESQEVQPSSDSGLPNHPPPPPRPEAEQKPLPRTGSLPNHPPTTSNSGKGCFFFIFLLALSERRNPNTR